MAQLCKIFYLQPFLFLSSGQRSFANRCSSLNILAYIETTESSPTSGHGGAPGFPPTLYCSASPLDPYQPACSAYQHLRERDGQTTEIKYREAHGTEKCDSGKRKRKREGVDPWEFFLRPQQHSDIDPVKGTVFLFRFKVEKYYTCA